MRPVETHISLGIRSVSRSGQSLLCPHEETVDPYLPIAISRSLSEKSRGENSRRKKWFLFFSAKHIFSRKGCSAAKREKKSFFLGLICMSTFSNIFSSETTLPIEAKFQMQPPWDGGTKVCSNGPGHMTKMATLPVYGKNLKKSSSPEPKRPMTLKIGMQHWVLKYYQVCLNDDTGLTMTYITARSNLVPYAFVWENGKTMDFFKNCCSLWYQSW